MTKHSPLYRMIERRLNGTLAEFVAARRATRTWRSMTDELSRLTDMEISDETLRRWFADRIEVVSTVVVKDKPGRAA